MESIARVNLLVSQDKQKSHTWMRAEEWNCNQKHDCACMPKSNWNWRTKMSICCSEDVIKSATFVCLLKWRQNAKHESFYSITRHRYTDITKRGWDLSQEGKIKSISLPAGFMTQKDRNCTHKYKFHARKWHPWHESTCSSLWHEQTWNAHRSACFYNQKRHQNFESVRIQVDHNHDEWSNISRLSTSFPRITQSILRFLQSKLCWNLDSVHEVAVYSSLKTSYACSSQAQHSD